MDFVRKLIAFLADNGVLPPEVTSSDKTEVERQKTYLQTLPDSPAKAYCVRWYDTNVSSVVNKQVGIYRIQVMMRNPKHGEVLREIEALWKFLLQRPEPIEDITDDCWVIFDIQSGPIPLGQDDKGNYLYSLNFPVKTQLF